MSFKLRGIIDADLKSIYGTIINNPDHSCGINTVFMGPTGPTGSQGFISNSTIGRATLNGITGVGVSTSSVTTNSYIFVDRNSRGSTPSLVNLGFLLSGDVINNTSFKIYSSNASDTGNVDWMIIN